MRPLFEKHDVDRTRPQIWYVPRKIEWVFSIKNRGQLWGKAAVGPRNMVNWWIFPANWKTIPFCPKDKMS